MAKKFKLFGKPKMKLGQYSKKRKQELLYMAMAVILIAVIVPVVSHFIVTWNGTIGSSSNWVFMGENDTIPEDFWDHYTEEETSDIMLISDNATEANTRLEDQGGFVVWGKENHSLIIGSDLTDLTLSIITIVWDLNISDILENEWLRWNLSIGSDDATWRAFIKAYDSDDVPLDASFGSILYDTGVRTGNHTFYVNFTALELVTVQSDRGGDQRLVLIIRSQTDHFNTGDIVSFSMGHWTPSPLSLNSMDIWKYGALGMGIVLLLVALASTPWWNPADPGRNGWLDVQIDKVKNRKKRKGKK